MKLSKPQIKLPKVSRPERMPSLNISVDPLISWFPFAVTLTVVFFAMYVGFQQVLRQAANDPQVEYSASLKSSLATGTLPDSSMATDQIDMASSLGTFFMILDQEYKVLFSTALLDGNTPVPPAGVMEVAKNTGQNRITWQPKPGVRTAIVVSYFSGENNGFVIVGRSLAEVDARTTAFATGTAVAWAISMILSLAAVTTADRLKARRNS